MTDLSKIARPYAKAIFELADKAQALAAWSERLNVLAMIAADPVVIHLMKNPKFSDERLVELFVTVAGDALNEEAKGLLNLLSHFKRLSCLPDIARLYEEYKARKAQVVNVEMISAIPVDESYQQRVQAKLSERLSCQIELLCQTDPSLLGGAIIRAGDYVIDGSVKGRLLKLKESIVS